MKKSIFLTMAAALMMCFVACDKEDEKPANNGNNNGNNYSQLIVGTWRIDNMTLDGEERTPSNMQLTFDANGRGVLSDNGVTENNDFGWSIDGSTVTITPHNGTYTYTIGSLTATECSFSGNMVPGTDIQGAVNIHMVKVNGDDPNPNPNPNPNPAPDAFPAGTQWECSLSQHQVEYDTIDGIVDSMEFDAEFTFTLAYNNTGNTGTLTMEASISGFPFPMEDMSIPFTYTYDATTQMGTMTLTDTDEETGQPETMLMPFRFDESQNAMVIDVPEEAQAEFGASILVFNKKQ